MLQQDIFVSPKPTTFKVTLINSQDFNIKYLGKNKFSVKIAGKQYHPDNLGESERASQAISDLLELNYAPAEGKEQTGGGGGGTESTPSEPGAAELGPELAAGEATPPAETPAEETPPAAPTVSPNLDTKKNWAFDVSLKSVALLKTLNIPIRTALFVKFGKTVNVSVCIPAIAADN